MTSRPTSITIGDKKHLELSSASDLFSNISLRTLLNQCIVGRVQQHALRVCGALAKVLKDDTSSYHNSLDGRTAGAGADGDEWVRPRYSGEILPLWCPLLNVVSLLISPSAP